MKFLKVKQIYYQLKKRYSSKKAIKFPARNTLIDTKLKIKIDELDLNIDYLERFEVEKLFENKVKLLNEEHSLDLSEWHEPEASHLWNFNLHYLEYLIPLAAKYLESQNKKYYIKFKEILTEWIHISTLGKRDAWASYTISLRIPNLLICLEMFGDIFNEDSDFQEIVIDNLFLQYRYLLQNQELDLLGNHYFENLKTIVIASLYFDDKKVFEEYWNKLILEIDEQILDDGMHFELSLMYHKIILEDILRIAVALKETRPNLVNLHLRPIIKRMVDILVSLEKGMGKMPFFNDAADNVSKETVCLVSAAGRLLSIVPHYKDSFSSSKYHKLYQGDIAVMFDTGEIGPTYMAGHGHCDALSFELSVNKEPVFVNSGTFQYQSDLRWFFRSTEAHNTLTIGKQQQSECWGEHRTGRRIKQLSFEKKSDGLSGSYKNYLDNSHYREICFVDKKKIRIQDKVKSKNEETIHSYLHLSPLLKMEMVDGKYVIKDTSDKTVCTVNFENVDKIHIHIEGILSNYSPVFGVLQKKNVVELLWNSKYESSEIYLNFN